LTVAVYALAIKPLIDKLRVLELSVKQVWFVDDATATGRTGITLSMVGTHNYWAIFWILPECGQNSPSTAKGSRIPVLKYNA